MAVNPETVAPASGMTCLSQFAVISAAERGKVGRGKAWCFLLVASGSGAREIPALARLQPDHPHFGTLCGKGNLAPAQLQRILAKGFHAPANQCRHVALTGRDRVQIGR